MLAKRKSGGSEEQELTKPPPPKRQSRLVAPKRRVTYGRRNGPRIPRDVLNRDLNQATVTQLWNEEFSDLEQVPEGDDLRLNGGLSTDQDTTKMGFPQNVESAELNNPPDDHDIPQEADHDGSGKYGMGSRVKKHKGAVVRDAVPTSTALTSKRRSSGDIPHTGSRRKPRRRTDGDVLPRQDGLQQQTMTQWHRSFSSISDSQDQEEVLEQDLDHDMAPVFEHQEGISEQDMDHDMAPALKRQEQVLEQDLDHDIASVLEHATDDDTNPSPSDSTPAKVGQTSQSTNPVPQGSESHHAQMGPPQTPRRVRSLEVPSSQSPATPLSLPSRGSTLRRNPLMERRINSPTPTRAHERLDIDSDKLPRMEIEDTYDTDTSASQLSRIPSTPVTRSSPTKSVRFLLHGEITQIDTIIHSDRRSPSPPQSPSPNKRLEVVDSDAGSEDEDIEFSAPQRSIEAKKTLDSGHNSEIEQEYEESQEEVSYLRQSNGQPEETLSSEHNSKTGQEDQDLPEGLSNQKHEEPETFYEGFGKDTQVEAQKLNPFHQGMEDEMDDYVEGKTQMMESQRLSFQQRKSMATITAQSDAFVSLPPSKVTEIISRARDHEIRPWRLPPPVCRLWIYETSPTQALKYMAEIGPLKRPGQIEDERGVENAAFNKRPTSRSWSAYEILQVYELSNMQAWAELKAKGWLNRPPTKFSAVPPAVAGELIYNIKCPLFTRQAQSTFPASSMTDTQEAEAQLMSTMKQFTQADDILPRSSSPATETSKENALPPLRGTSPASVRRNAFVQSQATTVDLTQPHTPRYQAVIDFICESPTRPLPSSSTKARTPAAASSDHEQASLYPFTLPSSQLMSKSQMLPDSLLDDTLAMPAQILDSIDDNEDED